MNKNLYFTEVNRGTSILCCILALALGVGGCSGYRGYKSSGDPLLDDKDSEFQKGRDRPPTVKTLHTMADVLAAQGKDSDCEFILKRTIQLYPEFLPAYNSLAELQMRQGHVNEATDTITAALKVQPRDSVLLNNLGMCCIVRREYQKALDMFTIAAGIMPDHPRYRANMAVALGLMGRDAESLSLLKQVLPDDQANHNLKVIREARESANRVRTDSKSN